MPGENSVMASVGDKWGADAHRKKQRSSECSYCPHVSAVGENTWDDIRRKTQLQTTCETCSAKGPNLWLCMHAGCLYIGCGDSGGHEDHSSQHTEDTQHLLALNLTSIKIWCYECGSEVLQDNNVPPLLMKGQSLSLSNLSKPVNPERVHSATYRAPYPSTHTHGIHEESETDDDDENQKPRGLTGLQNIGNTCYMNAALQSLSNCPPLMGFFHDCSGFVRTDKKPMLSKSFLKLMDDMWHKKRPSYVVPSSVAHGIKLVHPMFRGYSQQDSQEFLRCFMDQLHEELKAPIVNDSSDQGEENLCSIEKEEEEETEGQETDTLVKVTSTKVDINSQSDTDYETCDSGLSSERSSVEPSIASGDEGTLMDTDRNSLDSQADLNTPTLENGSQNSELDRDSAISSSMSSVTTSGDKISGVKFRKENENNEKKHAQTADESKDTIVAMETGDYSDAIAEMEPLQKAKSVKNWNPSASSQKISRSRQSSETEKSGRMRSPNMPQNKKKKTPVYRSVISDIFDGKILSSVQCLTCERVSSTKETFQDLSLPIPSKDHLHVIHASQAPPSQSKGTCGEVTSNQNLLSRMVSWMMSWFWGPTITLKDCLAAFFSADELKGDNMYSCEKCKKLRNGIKFSKVMALPEILCIHLKRFRHEFMFSTKISSYVSFPLEGLDMGPYLHKDCRDQVTQYDLIGVICHHGTAGGGHYTAYALNYISEQWYEFDDQYVTEVDMQQVENCEAYVLFYRKKNDHMMPVREKASQIMEVTESTFMKFYVSKQWINKFNNFSDPGPITNSDFLCRHGGVHPNKWSYVEDLVQEIPQKLWEFLHERYGGGPAVSHLSQCATCQLEMDRLKKRQKFEKDTFVQLNDEFKNEDNPSTIYAISMQWFNDWENFVRGRTDEPPGPIDNSKIAITKGGITTVKTNSGYGQVSEDMWLFLYRKYGGGPELVHSQIQPASNTLAHRVNDAGDASKASPEVKA